MEEEVEEEARRTTLKGNRRFSSSFSNPYPVINSILSHPGSHDSQKPLFLYLCTPKVKVRTDGQDDQPPRSWSSLLSLKDVQFLCLQDSCSPARGHQDESPPPIARIPKSYSPTVIMPRVSVSEGTDKKNNFTEEDRPNIRASSIPRPRAVLSSPDNDAVIGNNYNKTKVAKILSFEEQATWGGSCYESPAKVLGDLWRQQIQACKKDMSNKDNPGISFRHSEKARITVSTTLG
ncbi:hypothetical protein OIU84_021634 [Salix udensis]|uniref:Uncharacterized protein n=1 Tax=Salix udensis TaxID=889485 RepID=A0AAD6KXM6_9ROSI|nr:hypothetical protein OIU84_021634 [Salix udensis]